MTIPPVSQLRKEPIVEKAPPAPAEQGGQCPVCNGTGHVTPDMSRDQMVMAIDQSMKPVEEEVPMTDPANPEASGLSDTDVSRLGARARTRMSGRNIGR